MVYCSVRFHPQHLLKTATSINFIILHENNNDAQTLMLSTEQIKF